MFLVAAVCGGLPGLTEEVYTQGTPGVGAQGLEGPL